MKQPEVPPANVLTDRQLRILRACDFFYEETQIAQTDEGSEQIEIYTGDIHRIIYWKERDLFSIKNVDTSISTMIVPFDIVMKRYFDEMSNIRINREH